MSRHLGRVAAPASGPGGWKPLRGRLPERVATPRNPWSLAVPALLAVQGLPYLGDGGWYPVLRQLTIVLSVVIVWQVFDERRRYARHISFVPGPATLVLGPGGTRGRRALALREHLGLTPWMAWRVAGRSEVPLVVDVDPPTVAATRWALGQAGAGTRVEGVARPARVTPLSP